MKNKPKLSLSVFFFFFFFFYLAAVTSDLESDRRALVAVRNSVRGRPLLWNMTASSPCNWHGVLCTRGRVTALRLPGAGLFGSLPIGGIGNLTELQTLSLRFNSLSGPIPSDFSNLVLLRYLYLQERERKKRTFHRETLKLLSLLLNFFENLCGNFLVLDSDTMFGLKKHREIISNYKPADSGCHLSSKSNPFDSDDELDDTTHTLKPSNRIAPEPSVAAQRFSLNPFDDDDEVEKRFTSSSKPSDAKSRCRNDFRDSGGVENQTVQELESYAVYKSE